MFLSFSDKDKEKNVSFCYSSSANLVHQLLLSISSCTPYKFPISVKSIFDPFVCCYRCSPQRMLTLWVTLTKTLRL